jgi:hypothetical protein
MSYEIGKSAPLTQDDEDFGWRASLGFDTIVVSALQFLIDEFGFRISLRTPITVRFESQHVVLVVFHGAIL